VKARNHLGTSFSVWNKKNADGSESQVNEFTILYEVFAKGIPDPE